MIYLNAKSVLPDKLINEIQSYVNGKIVYIPMKQDNIKKWGSISGIKDDIISRNENIRIDKKNGYSIDELSQEYGLAYDTIKKIVYTKR